MTIHVLCHYGVMIKGNNWYQKHFYCQAKGYPDSCWLDKHIKRNIFKENTIGPQSINSPTYCLMKVVTLWRIFLKVLQAANWPSVVKRKVIAHWDSTIKDNEHISLWICTSWWLDIRLFWSCFCLFLLAYLISFISPHICWPWFSSNAEMVAPTETTSKTSLAVRKWNRKIERKTTF